MTDNSQIKVIVGMSGGVDSSVSAYLLQQQGYQVEGLFMKNWEEDDTDEYCSAAQDLADAKAVCDKLGMKLHTINFAAEYWDNVFEHFLEEYKATVRRTPISCATRRSSSRRSWSLPPKSWGPPTSPPATMYAVTTAPAARACCAAWIPTRIRATSSTP